MNNKYLVPKLKRKFSYAKAKEVPGWRGAYQQGNNDFSIDSKLPSILSDRADYYRNLIYPHWNLDINKSEHFKNTDWDKVQKRSLEVLRGKEGILDYERRNEFQMIPGKNIVIGSVTCRDPPSSAMPHGVVVQQSCKNFRIKKTGFGKFGLKQRQVNNVQFGFGENLENCGLESKNIETEASEQDRIVNHADENELIVDMLNTSTSRTASAIVFGSKKTLLDVYTSALHSGSAKNSTEAKSMIKRTLDQGVLIKSSQKIKLYIKADPESDSNDSSLSDISKENEDSGISAIFPSIAYRRKSTTYESEAGFSSIHSKDDNLESISTNIASSIRKSQESVRSHHQSSPSKDPKPKKSRKSSKVERNRNRAKTLIKSTNNGKEFKLKLKELANIEVLDDDDHLLKFRSKSVTHNFELKSLSSSSRGEWRKSKETNEKNENNEENIKKENNDQSGILKFQIPKPKTEQKTPSSNGSKSKLPVKKTKPKELKTRPNNKIKTFNFKKQAPLIKLPQKVESDIKEEFLTHTLKVKHEEQERLKEVEKYITKEEIAERILQGYRQAPLNMRRSSLVLDPIQEKPKLSKKRESMVELNSKKLLASIKVSKPRITKTNLDPQIESPAKTQDPVSEDLNETTSKKRATALIPRPSNSNLKDSKDSTDNKDVNKSYVKKSTYGEKSFKSSLSIRTDDFGYEKTWSRSSSIKKSIPVISKPKKVRRNRRKNSGSSKESSLSEDLSSESQEEFERPKDPKRETIIYELNQLEKLKLLQADKDQEPDKLEKENEDLADEKTKLDEDLNPTGSDSGEDFSIDFDLSLLMNNKNFHMNKFAFTPQVIFRFSSRADTNPLANVNDIQLNEYNVDHENFDSFINKKRFCNINNTVSAGAKSGNKYLEILNLEEYLPIQVYKQKMKEFERMRKKDKILQSRGLVVEIAKKPKFSFSGLPDVYKKEVKECGEEVICDKDIVRSGGSLLVKDEIHQSERKYCRVKDLFFLESLSGVNSNSAERLLNSLKASLKILDRVSK